MVVEILQQELEILLQQVHLKVFLVEQVKLLQLIEEAVVVAVQLLQEEMPHLLNKLEMVEQEQQQVLQEVQ